MATADRLRPRGTEPRKPVRAWRPTLRLVGVTIQAMVVAALATATLGAAFRDSLFRSTACGGDVDAISTLRGVSSALEQFRDAGVVDLDGDGRGEFGSFRELSGAVWPRVPEAADSTAESPPTGVPSGALRVGTGELLNPPVLSGALRTINSSGHVMRSGWLFCIYLPTRAGGTITADLDALMEEWSVVDPDAAELTYVVYAWRACRRSRSAGTFMVSANGSIYGCTTACYSGEDGGPRPGAAFTTGGLDAIGATPADGVAGQDGHVWRLVN